MSLHLRGQPARKGESGRKGRPSSPASPSSLGAARGRSNLPLPPGCLSPWAFPSMYGGSNGVRCQVQPQPCSPKRAAPVKWGPGARLLCRCGTTGRVQGPEMALGARLAPALLFRLKHGISKQRGPHVSAVKEGPENRRFHLCGPHPPVCNDSSLLWWPESSHGRSDKSARRVTIKLYLQSQAIAGSGLRAIGG